MIQKAFALAIILLFANPSMARAADPFQDTAKARLRGRVSDAQTGEPLAKVKVIVIGLEFTTSTDENGDFVLQDLPPGEVELYVSTVGYGLVKKGTILRPGEETKITIALNQEAAPLLGEITVTPGPFIETETNVASEQTLNKSELQALATVLAGDPTRAAQALPGVAGNDDFRSEFTLRGAGFRRIGFYLDDLPLPQNPAHTLLGNDTVGSVSIFSTDTIGAVSLLSGAFPAKYGDATAGIFHLETREGNRVKPAGRFTVGLLNSSVLFDGPLNKGRGAWLAAARKSYVSYLVNRLTDGHDIEETNLALDFTDAQAKLAYDPHSHHRLGITAVWSLSEVDRSRNRDQLDPFDLLRSDTLTKLGYVKWDYQPGPRFVLRSKVLALDSGFTNRNPDGLPLEDGHLDQSGLRSDLSFLVHPAHRIEAGLYARWVQSDGFEGEPIRSRPSQLMTLRRFEEVGNQQGYYLQETWSSQRLRLALTVGSRIDHWGLTGETVVTPRAALSLNPLEKTRLRLGWGQYAEFPDFRELFGVRGDPGLRAERATHYNASIEQLIDTNTRVVVELYDREDKDLFFSLDDVIEKGSRRALLEFPFRNSLRGYARGAEISLHRRSANRLAGWVSYSYSKTRQTDATTGFSFPSDFDQRHTLNLYGTYRITPSLNFSTLWRYGSGLPMVGFFREQSFRARRFLVPGSERNRIRLPAYSRLDVRVNKAIYFRRSKLTLSAELINALGRENFRQRGLTSTREKLLPFVPSAGIAFEF